MQLDTFQTASQFLAVVQEDLEQFETKNSLILGITLSLRKLPVSLDITPTFIVVREQDVNVLIAVLVPPHPVLLAIPGKHSASSFQLLADYLCNANLPVSGVNAADGYSSIFAEEWIRMTGKSVKHTIHQKLFQLTKVVDNLPAVKGTLRPATLDDLGLMRQWITAFEIDVFGESHMPSERVMQRVTQGELYIWESETPHCMAGKSRPTDNTISINGVYTPKEWRRQGFATATVANLSKELLDEGYSKCVLYTDMANPTSNCIYQKIGYEPVCNFAHVHFNTRA